MREDFCSTGFTWHWRMKFMLLPNRVHSPQSQRLVIKMTTDVSPGAIKVDVTPQRVWFIFVFFNPSLFWFITALWGSEESKVPFFLRPDTCLDVAHWKHSAKCMLITLMTSCTKVLQRHRRHHTTGHYNWWSVNWALHVKSLEVPFNIQMTLTCSYMYLQMNVIKFKKCYIQIN